jgi:ketosteroid isomerase-like protein
MSQKRRRFAQRRDTARAMSQENVEIVRAALQAFTDGGVDAAAEFWDGDINWRAIEGAPDDVGEMHGRERVRRYFGELLETFANVTVTPVELLDIGDDRVVGVQHLAGRAKLSGIETEMRFAAVYTLRNGKIVRGREYIDREQALEAVGLSEQDAHADS